MDLYGLLSLLFRGVLEIARDLGASVSSLAGPSDATAAERALTIADIIALAALADGQVTPDELKTLQQTEIGEGELAVAAVDRLYALDLPAEDLQSPEWLDVMVSDLAMRLTPEDRAQAMHFVLLLAAHGSRLKERELASGRVVGVEARELVALFAKALGIGKDELASLQAAIEEAPVGGDHVARPSAASTV